MRQRRGRKFTEAEIAYLKHLENRFLNDTELAELFEKEVGKSIDRKHVNHIRNGLRWKNVKPSHKKPE